MSAAVQPEVDHPSTTLLPIRAAVVWGTVFGLIQAASPLALRWLDPATVYGLSLILIAPVYIGFAVADGRPMVIAVESVVAAIFILTATLGISGPAWLLVVGLLGHGLKDLWQHRSQYVAGTRCWPPFCCAVDLVAALCIAFVIMRGML